MYQKARTAFVKLASFVCAIGTVLNVQAAPLPTSTQAKYDLLFADNRFDITLALGYDEEGGDSSPSPILIPMIGPPINHIRARNPNLQGRRLDVHNIETAIMDCKECGFTRTSVQPGREIFESSFVYQNRKIQTHLTFIYPTEALSPAKLKEEFIELSRTSDLTIYLGHSRNGEGAPDFGPSSELDGKVIHKNSFGRGWKGFEQPWFSSEKYQVFFMNSCLSRKFYFSQLRAHQNQLGLIMTNANPHFYDFPATMIAVVSGMIQQMSPEEIMSNLEKASQAFYYFDRPSQDKTLYSADGFLE